MTKFEEVLKIDVSGKTEKKGNLTYLSWAWAWAEFKKVYPDASYEVKKFDGFPYVHDTDTGYLVYTSVTAEGQTYEMWLPVMDARNKALMNATMFDINKTIMRCLTKNLAMFGLGLYIYAGEDLPEDGEKPSKTGDREAKGQASGKQTSAGQSSAQSTEERLKAAMEMEITIKNVKYKIGTMSQEQLLFVKNNAKVEKYQEAAALVLKYRFQKQMQENDDGELPFKDDETGD